ncbi:GyrI-like domain-containing protein [Methylobacterium sp. NEAU 140]|uniref:GyrI-like domain-containing protein n=1 Tax=Methylobacterium sp. NEAU 140 TaxID=3064945 RepID=UPI002732D890|nr:GyrI-like domain-containing protein [Methylobacterium sp. NEAU 140]MDP4023918.1 GyrI-like domain-containing protein [Methylobacterium sp. NEAU 140]
MIRPRRPRAALAAALAVSTVLSALAAPAGAQNAAPPPSTAPSPAQTSPLPTTTAPNPPADPNRSAAPAPEQAVRPPPAGQSAVGANAGAAGGAAVRPTLVEKPAEAGDVDEVVLPAKPAAILPGKTKWDEAVPSLKQAFARIEADLAKAGIAPAGRPLAVFTHTDDDGFTYEAMIPVAAAPSPAPAEGDGLRFGTTPSGKALRFAHKGSYEGIDGTYETLTTYLDAKDIVVQDRFVEEYASDLKDASDDGLDVNIYALLR